MLLLKFIFICVLIKSNTAERNSVPVLIIDHDKALSKIFNIAPNPLTRVSQESFGSVLHGAIKKSDLILIFVEKTFCMEDITKKDRSGTPYQYLKRSTAEKKVLFLPSVVEPFTVISQMFRPQVYNVFYIADEPPATMFEMRFKYYYIFFKDSDEGVRAKVLRRHDNIISKVYSLAGKVSKDIISFYTGKKNPVVFEPMMFVPVKPISSSKSDGITVVSSGAMFRFVGIHSHSATRRSAFNQKPVITEELWEKDNKLSTKMAFADFELQFNFTFQTTGWKISIHSHSATRRSAFNQKPVITEELWEKDNKLSTKMAFADFELQFNFTFQTTGWKINTVSIVEGGEEVGVTRMDVGAPLSCSYVCSVPLTITNTRDNSQVTISRYQKILKFIYICYKILDAYLNKANLKSQSVYTYSQKIQPLVEVNSVGDFTKRAVSPNTSHIYKNIQYKPAGFRFGPRVNCSPYFTSQIMAGLFVTAVCLSILTCGVGALFDVLSNDRFDDPASKINFGVIDG